jgi:hypothetical protein
MVASFTRAEPTLHGDPDNIASRTPDQQKPDPVLRPIALKTIEGA